MRIAIAMIAKVGLVITEDESDLDRRTAQAWKIFRASYRPRSRWAPSNVRRRWVTGEAKAAAAEKKALRRERSRNFHPIIRFVGVWDTVSAYGGPISEITQAIDNWFVRLSMPNYALADSVRCARHALSIDDERDSFHPLLWDELHEERAIAEAEAGKKPKWIDKNRLEQVWFTGMHADVGGGYPDESLSYVSFLWMLEEAEKAGLRPVPLIVARFRALASSAGPIHNSRAGLASYYRYQPRRIAVWMEPLDPSLLTRRHPDLEQGLIRTVKVHESVAARIASGTDRYAPIPLPAEIDVVPPQRRGENAPQQAGEGISGCILQPPQGPPLPLVLDELRRRFEDEDRSRVRVAGMKAVWAQVAWRRRLYFTSLFLTLALVLMPLWDGWVPGTPPVLASGHGLIGGTITALGGVLPSFLHAVVASWASHPLFVLLLAVLLILTNVSASRLERKLRDDARRLWDASLAPLGPERKDGSAAAANEQTVEEQRQDTPTPWQRLRRYVRWRGLPMAILALIVALLLWLLLILFTRILLTPFERWEGACERQQALTDGTEATFDLSTRNTCNFTGLHVKKGQHYSVEMEVLDGWKDGDHEIDPRGLSAADIGFWGYVGVPLRRAINANYLQPVVHIYGGEAGPVLQPLELEQRATPLSNWRGEFEAARDGNLSLFANDSLPLGFVRRFYDNNQGTAKVTVRRVKGLTESKSESVKPNSQGGTR